MTHQLPPQRHVCPSVCLLIPVSIFLPTCPPPPPSTQIHGSRVPLQLSSPGALSVFVLGFHACRTLITLYLPRAGTCLCFCGLLARLDHLFTRAGCLLVTLHANEQPRAQSTRLRAGAANDDKSSRNCFLSAAPDVSASEVVNECGSKFPEAAGS